MSYSPPSIDATGLHSPAYSDIVNWLIGQFLGIFGNAAYLGTDSADYQDLAVRALQSYDASQLAQMIYLSFSPLTATGVALDLVAGKLIGVARRTASHSVASVLLTGTAGTVIRNGVVRDVNGLLWDLPSSVTIGSLGTLTVMAISESVGNVGANAGDISAIATPTAGWTGVINLADATPGTAVEPDSTYRARLILSQAKPSLTRLAGTAAAVAAVSGVTRSVIYENKNGYTMGYGIVSTSGTAVTLLSGYPFDSSQDGQAITIAGTAYTIDTVAGTSSLTLGSSAGSQASAVFIIGDGISLGPAHSITCVAEGGAVADIAQAIYGNHGIGCQTNGSTMVTVADPLNPAITMPISFDVLLYTPIYVALTVHALNGFTSATQAAIAADITAYLNSLGIGQAVLFSELYGAALDARPNPDTPLFSIRSIQSGAMAAQTTGTLTDASPTVPVASATGIVNGQTVVGDGIPVGTTITISGSTVTLSANATKNGVSVPLRFFALGTSDIPVSFECAAQSSAALVLVTLV
jgi:uncharacterized phage protein gp47/JayE